jgi:hypothetical protein
MIDPYNAGIDVMDLTQSHRRSRRSIWDGLKFRLEAPSVDWQKLVGSKSIGASFGVIMMNLLDLVVGRWLFTSLMMFVYYKLTFICGYFIQQIILL